MTLSVVVLLGATQDADATVALLRARLRTASGVVVERPPDELLGWAFLSRPEQARTWWESAGAAAASQWLMLMDDTPALAAEIEGVASRWIIRCQDDVAAAAYDALSNARGVVASDVAAFAAAVLGWLERDREFAQLIRPSWGPFQRQSGDHADAATVDAAEAAVGDGDAELAGVRTDEKPGHRDRDAGQSHVIGAPPPEFGLSEGVRAHLGERGPTDAPGTNTARAEGASRSAGEGRGGFRDGRLDGAVTQGAMAYARAAVPPPPPVSSVGPAAVPLPPQAFPTAIPVPLPAPPRLDVAAGSPQIATNATETVMPPPAPAGDVGSAGPSVVDTGELPATAVESGSASEATSSVDVGMHDGASPSHAASTGENGAGAAHQPADWAAAEVASLVASNAAPLDELSLLEPRLRVVDAAERKPRQVGLFSVPASLGRKLLRSQADQRPTRSRDRRSSATTASSVVGAPPLAEMTEPELRGEAARRLMLGPPLIVVCCSRKGGVGKTYDILGIAELGDEAGEAFAVRSVLLEQNLENPDLRVVLGLGETTATVRQLDRALADGMEAPSPAHPTKSNLSVYVEERETGSYPRESIERMAQHCRARFGLSAVDLANCLPDVTGGKAAAAVAHWLRVADVVVMPTDTSTSGLKGLAEMIDAVRAQDYETPAAAPGVVIPFLIQPGGKALQYPGIAEILARYDGQGAQPVAVPFSEETQLAGWENAEGERTTILDDDEVRLAYWKLLVAALRAGGARGAG